MYAFDNFFVFLASRDFQNDILIFLAVNGVFTFNVLVGKLTSIMSSLFLTEIL